MKLSTSNQAETLWPKSVLKKLLNISKESDFLADPDEGDSNSNSDDEEFGGSGEKRGFQDNEEDEVDFQSDGTFLESTPKLRRQNSETLRAQYINNKELRICVGTWNVGGKLPSADLDISDWLDMNKPADVYVLGFQEIVPLNAGNIFGTEDSKPVPKWENVIRETLNKSRPVRKSKFYSDPPSPSKFNPSDDFPDIEDGTDSDSGNEEDIHPLHEDYDNYDYLPPTVDNEFTSTQASVYTENANFDASKERELQRQSTSARRLNSLNSLRVEDPKKNSEAPLVKQNIKLAKQLSVSETIGLSWPDPPLNLVSQRVLEKPKPVRSVKSFRKVLSFKKHNPFNTSSNLKNNGSELASLINEIDLASVINRKRKPFVRIVSKQMVGIFLSVWVRRGLRKHVHNLKVSTVGVGVMGYIGNKGSISISMSIYQTLFCFICAHLSSGEKDGDGLRRNTNVQEIHRRTQFRSMSGISFPKYIHDHERIIWFGDLNYRIDLSYEKTRELISKQDWSKLAEKDQLVRELKKGRAFDGWTECALDFPPTYKYENNSQKYCGEDPKFGRRIPSWCDRILSFGKGLKLVSHKRTEKLLSDHRPVTAVYVVEVEVFSHRKLQRALKYTDAELKNGDVMHDILEIDGLSRSRFGEVSSLQYRLRLFTRKLLQKQITKTT